MGMIVVMVISMIIPAFSTSKLNDVYFIYSYIVLHVLQILNDD